MALHDTENAVKFESREDCLHWIEDRIVRFKLKLSHGQDKDGNFAVGPLRKADGKIMDTKAEGFKEGGIDEPLKNYAEPSKQDGEWLAIMRLQG